MIESAAFEDGRPVELDILKGLRFVFVVDVDLDERGLCVERALTDLMLKLFLEVVDIDFKRGLDVRLMSEERMKYTV